MSMRVMLALLDRLGQPVGPERSALMSLVTEPGWTHGGPRWQLTDPVQWVHVSTPIRAIAVRELPDEPDINGRRWCVPITLAPNPPLTHVFTLRRLNDLLLPGLAGDPDDMTAPDPFDSGALLCRCGNRQEQHRTATEGGCTLCPCPGFALDARDELDQHRARREREQLWGPGLPAVDRPLVAHLERAHGRWRVGRHFPEHVYAGDTPVATFVGDRDTAASNARQVVLDHNRMVPGIPDGEWVVIPPMGWGNRISELLQEHGVDINTPPSPDSSRADDTPLLRALVQLICEWGVQG